MFKKLFVVAFIYKLAFFDYAYAEEVQNAEIIGVTNNPVKTTAIVFVDYPSEIIYVSKEN
jgi:hypothetical protein